MVSVPQEIRILACKKCGSPINNRLCGGEKKESQFIQCEHDGMDITERPDGTVETRVYILSRVEPYRIEDRSSRT